MSHPVPSQSPHPDPSQDTADDAVIGRAFRRSIFVIVGIALVVLTVIAGGYVWKGTTTEVTEPSELRLPESRRRQTIDPPRIPFTDITSQAGIDFVHRSGATGEKLLPETMGGGCLFLDYDADGDQDIALVNARSWTWDDTHSGESTVRIYANDGKGHFQDETDRLGLNVDVYGMGGSAADFDNDGYPDLFITAVGKNVFLKNEHGESFDEQTEQWGVAGDSDRWSTSSAWLDFDRDGDLDLFVCNYVHWSRPIDLQQGFQLTGIGRAYGPPMAFEGTQAYFYRNDGSHFVEIAQQAGLHQVNPATGVPLPKSLGVVPVDIDRDGWLDLVVANDTVRNLVYRNQQDGTFEEIGVQSGISFDSQGKARGAMGIDAAYYRNDDCLAIAIANFANEMTALYVCPDGNSLFTDDAIPTGLGPQTRLDLSFGLYFFDADLDGRLDLLSANGHLENEINRVQSSQHYRQPTRLFWNAGSASDTEFVPLTEQHLGEQFLQPMVGRGASYADIDADGDLDVLLTQIDGPARLLQNNQTSGHHYLRLALVGKQSNRDAIGAEIELVTDSGTQRRLVMPYRSYLSQTELPVTFGLGQTDSIKQLSILWPSGKTQILNSVEVDQTLHVEE